tara:strand:+ start:4725 stop:5045 length:321 start_codon:yes stop_codon:yes gene_type:complete
MNWLLAQMYSAAGIKQIEIDLENQLLSQENRQCETNKVILPDETRFMAPTGHIHSKLQATERLSGPNCKAFCPATAPPPCHGTHGKQMYEAEYFGAPVLTAAGLEP